MGCVQGLAEIVLWVHDLPASVAFYRDVLGLSVISPSERTNPIFLQAGPAQVGIPQMVVLVQLPDDAPPFGRPRTLHHLALAVASGDFDAERQRLKQLGFTLRSGQHPVVPSHTMYLDDPDGNEVELICQATAAS